jgi:hypothetical protein
MLSLFVCNIYAFKYRREPGGNKHGIMIPELLLGEELLRLIYIRVEITKDF